MSFELVGGVLAAVSGLVIDEPSTLMKPKRRTLLHSSVRVELIAQPTMP